MKLNITINNSDREIERVLGLDEGTLVREDLTYFTAEKNGDSRVGIVVKQLNNGKIIIEELRLGAKEDEEFEEGQAITEFLDHLNEANHLAEEDLMKFYEKKFILKLGEKEVSVQFDAVSYNAFCAALEMIKSEMI